eukprot:5570975-Amphidinium_carterae.1
MLVMTFVSTVVLIAGQWCVLNTTTAVGGDQPRSDALMKSSASSSALDSFVPSVDSSETDTSMCMCREKRNLP